MSLKQVLEIDMKNRCKEITSMPPYISNKLLNLINQINIQEQKLSHSIQYFENILEEDHADDILNEEHTKKIQNILKFYKDRVEKLKNKPEGIIAIEKKTNLVLIQQMMYFLNECGMDIEHNNTLEANNSDLYKEIKYQLDLVAKSEKNHDWIEKKLIFDESTKVKQDRKNIKAPVPISKKAMANIINANAKIKTKVPSAEEEQLERTEKLIKKLYETNCGAVAVAKKYIQVCNTCIEYITYQKQMNELHEKLNSDIVWHNDDPNHDIELNEKNEVLKQYYSAFEQLDEYYRALTVNLARYYKIVTNAKDHEDITQVSDINMYIRMSLAKNFAYQQMLFMICLLVIVVFVKPYIPLVFFNVALISLSALLLESTIKCIYVLVQKNNFQNTFFKNQKNNEEKNSIFSKPLAFFNKVVSMPAYLVNNNGDIFNAILPTLVITTLVLIEPELMILVTPFIHNSLLFQGLWMMFNGCHRLSEFIEKQRQNTFIPQQIQIKKLFDQKENNKKEACDQRNRFITDCYCKFERSLNEHPHVQDSNTVVKIQEKGETIDDRLSADYIQLCSILGLFSASKLEKSIQSAEKPTNKY